MSNFASDKTGTASLPIVAGKPEVMKDRFFTLGMRL